MSLINAKSSIGLILLASCFIGPQAHAPAYPGPDNAPLEIVNVKAYGAVGNGTGDDTPAFQAAIRACVFDKVRCRPIWVPPGTYKITNTLVFRNIVGLVFDGGGSLFLWEGAAGSPMFLIDDVRDSLFQNFEIRSSPAHPLQAAIRSENGAGNEVTPTTNHFERVVIDGTNPNGLGKGFQFALGAGGDANNDLNSFSDCRVSNYTVAGWSFEHSQSVAHSLVRPHLNGNRFGRYGITNALGPNANGGSFIVYDGAGGGNVVADIYLGSPNRTVRIMGFDSESSSSFLRCSGRGSSNYPTVITGLRFACNRLNVDTDAIVYLFPGPLEISFSVFYASTGPIHIRLNAGGMPALYDLHNNSFADPNSAMFEPVICDACAQARLSTSNLFRAEHDKSPAFGPGSRP